MFAKNEKMSFTASEFFGSWLGTDEMIQAFYPPHLSLILSRVLVFNYCLINVHFKLAHTVLNDMIYLKITEHSR